MEAVSVDLPIPDTARTAAGKKRSRAVVAALGGAAVVLAVVLGLRAARHTPRPSAPVAAPAPVAAAPAVVAIEPTPPPAPPARVAEPEAAPPPEAPAPVETAPRPRARRAAATKVERAAAKPALAAPRATAQGATKRPTKRLLAKADEPSADREAAHAAYERGNGLLLTGNGAGAITAYEEAVRLAPSDPVGYRGLGLAYEKEGRIPDAIKALVSYLKLSRHARDREVIARRLSRLTHSSR
jgi:outer membrane biosynthesis protein TonB